jgi:hypothetical protein
MVPIAALTGAVFGSACPSMFVAASVAACFSAFVAAVVFAVVSAFVAGFSLSIPSIRAPPYCFFLRYAQ